MSDNPAKKWAGKYESPDDLEKGYSELMREIARVKEQGVQSSARADALDRYTKQLEGALTQVQNNSAPPPQRRGLVDEDGRLDEKALMDAINSQIKPLQDQMASVPRVIQETLGGLLGPVQKQVTASNKFWAREDVEKSKFTQSEMNRFLNGSDPIRKVYETILSNPETAEEAYEYAYSVWASTRPKPASKIDEGKKLSAGQPTPSAGPTAQSPEEEGSWKRIQSLENQASFTRDPGVIQAALSERFKGTKIMEELNRYAEEKGYAP